ncbi:MAG: GntR family transcriptional regulator [Anaerolineae bacterium]|nr:GntR family transcriptional regulator [Anaerolineae bacterium]
MPHQLQRESANPLYEQLKISLRRAIANGSYMPHSRIPSERELCSNYHVSRMTARQAVMDLVREGMLYTRVGKGTFVADAKIEQPLRVLTGFSQDTEARAGQPRSQVLKAEVGTSTPAVAAALKLSARDRVILLKRVRYSDGVALAIEAAHIPFALCPKLLDHDFSRESLYQVMSQTFGLQPTRAEQSLEANLANDDELLHLQLIAPAAVLRIQRITYRQDGLPIEFVLSTYRGDRYKFSTVLQSS